MIASEIRDEPREFARTAKVLQLAHQPTQSEKSQFSAHETLLTLCLVAGRWSMGQAIAPGRLKPGLPLATLLPPLNFACFPPFLIY